MTAPAAAAPLGRDDLLAVLDAALSIGGTDEVEARAVHAWGGLARFARSAVHQHVAGDDTSVSVRVVVDGRVGVSTTNDASPTGAVAAAGRALASARRSQPDPGWPGVAGPADLPVTGPRFDPDTAEASPARRASAVAELLARLSPDQEGAGAVATGATEVALATTAGARLHGMTTRAALSTVVMSGDGSGHAEDAAVTLADLDPGEVGAKAAATCAAAADPVKVAPGTYEVVLLPSAVATLLEYLAFTTFSAKAYAEGRSAFCGRLGEEVASPLISIVDDALGPGAIGLPFDGEGTPKVRVPLVTGGMASGLVHDRATAAAAGVSSTGHGLPAPNPWGPMAGHLVLEHGDSTTEELIAGVDHGLLVTRFWYTRAVNPKRTLLTGMTRDGTFRIEGGRRREAVGNLRYNQSVLDALATCDGIGSRLQAGSDESSDSRAPALRLRSFNFK